AWDRAAIGATALSAGTAYWIARLSTAGGDLVTRVNGAVANPDRVDTRYATTLPTMFSPGGSYPHATSMYADTAGPPSPTVTPASTATPTRTVAPTPPPPSPTPAAGFVGNSSIAPNADPSGLGTAEANRFVSGAAGPVSSLVIYLDGSNRATKFALGLYADVAGSPGTLIAQGSSSSVAAGAWNAVAIPSITIQAATPYWIARLALAGGDLITRVDPTASNAHRP